MHQNSLFDLIQLYSSLLLHPYQIIYVHNNLHEKYTYVLVLLKSTFFTSKVHKFGYSEAELT